MQLAELLKDWPCSVTGGSIRVQVTGIEDDARKVKTGDIYVARKGKKTHGRRYIQQALKNGAVAIAMEEETIESKVPITIPVVWIPSCLKFLSFASAKFQSFPAEALTVIAITGTNGKTTVSHLVGQLLRTLGQQVAVIGTVGFYINGERQLSIHEHLTTLQAKELHPTLKYCIQQGVKYVVLEASSMGLVQHRLDDCAIDVGVFLNLTEDHLEDHGGLEPYKKAKALLGTLSNKLVLNGDDVFCRTIAMQTKKNRILFGEGNRVDLQLQLLSGDEDQTTFSVQTSETLNICTIPLTGAHNRQNALAAIATLWQLGFAIGDICAATAVLQLPDGRLQRIKNNEGLLVYVDYAHTASALAAVLQAVKREEGQLMLVFSCGGERDRRKRFEMGAIACKYADMIFLTTDNPRGENPLDINEEIVAGFTQKQCYDIILDRQKAIEEALLTAQHGDVVVIAGKGHEETQIFSHGIMHFSDREVVENFFEKRATDGVE